MDDKYPAFDELSDTHGELRDTYEQLRAEAKRLQTAHDHQRDVAGLMLREAERAGAEVERLRALLIRMREDERCARWHYDIDAAIDAEICSSVEQEKVFGFQYQQIR